MSDPDQTPEPPRERRFVTVVFDAGATANFFAAPDEAEALKLAWAARDVGKPPTAYLTPGAALDLTRVVGLTDVAVPPDDDDDPPRGPYRDDDDDDEDYDDPDYDDDWRR